MDLRDVSWWMSIKDVVDLGHQELLDFQKKGAYL
jgi:hypothetical protein